MLHQDKFLGILLATMFSDIDQLYAVRVVAYLLFLVTAAIIYFQSLSGRQFFVNKR
jgi:high-affinity Fe2+/Pb2+ permease